MARDVWQKTITNLQGDVLEGAQITVRDQQTDALATIFANQSGGSALANPFLTDAQGVARFFAEPGFYKVTAFKDGFGTAEFIWNNVGDNRLREDLPDSAANIYAKNNILGTVSQSGGVPTGAIIQRGSNANGEFVLTADGRVSMQRTISFNPVLQGTASLGFDFPFTGTVGDVSMNTSIQASVQGGTAGDRQARQKNAAFVRFSRISDISNRWSYRNESSDVLNLLGDIEMDFVLKADGYWF
jgi:hypothetical protein